MAEVVERVANLEARWDAQAAQLNGIQESLVRIEDKMDRKFEVIEDKWERRFGALEQRMDSGFAESRTEFRWLMGAMAGTALTVIVTILGALKKTLVRLGHHDGSHAPPPNPTHPLRDLRDRSGHAARTSRG